MTVLARERCVACRQDSPQVSGEEAQGLLKQIPDWKIVEHDGMKQLERAYRLKGFAPPTALAGKIAERADLADHHPKLTIEWGKLTVNWWTHAIKGLHRNDFIMAAQSDELFQEATKK